MEKPLRYKPVTWFNDTANMTFDERGVYADMMFRLWYADEPMKAGQLMGSIGLSMGYLHKHTTLLKQFVITDGFITHTRLMSLKKQGKKKTPEFEASHLKVAVLLRKRLHENSPKNRKYTDEDVKKWAETVRLMEKNDGLKVTDIRAMVEWCTSDDFWHKVIHSMEAIRKHYNKMNITRLEDAPESTYRKLN